MVDINTDLLQWFIYFFFDKQTVSGGDFNSKILSSECLSDLALSELAKERHKKIIRRFEKRKVH